MSRTWPLRDCDVARPTGPSPPRAMVVGPPEANYAVAVASQTLPAILAHLRDEGVRVTTARRVLLTALVDAEEHPTADQLTSTVQEMAPDVHPSTIYRNLDELERLGVVVHTHHGHGPATYHLAADAHPHLVCEVCGATVEAEPAMFAELVRQARARHGFVILPYHVAVLGRCAACATMP